MKEALTAILISLFAVPIQAQGQAAAQQQIVQVECRDLETTGNYLAPNETLINGKACRPAGTPIQAADPKPKSETPIVSTPPAPAVPATTPSVPAQQSQQTNATATICFYRAHRFQGYALKPSLYVDGVDIARLHNGESVDVTVPAGQHRVYSNDKATGIVLDAKAGQIYFMRVDIMTGAWKGHGAITLIDPQEGKYEASQTKLALTRDLTSNRELTATEHSNH